MTLQESDQHTPADENSLLPPPPRHDPTFVLVDSGPHQVQADLLVLPIFRGPSGPEAPDPLFIDAYSQANLQGDPEEDLLLPRRAGDPFRAEAVLLAGMGPRDRIDAAAVRRTARRIGFRYRRFAALATTLPQTLADPREGVRATIEGLTAGSYRFPGYGAQRQPESGIERVTLLVATADTPLLSLVESAAAVERAVAWSRDLVNIPAGFLSPAQLAEQARAMALHNGLTVRVWDEEALRRGGFGGIVGVGSGSRQPSRMIELRYTPAYQTADRVVALSGKGVTFDSGGLALKKCADMLEMKSDMAGAACVLAAMRVVAELAPADLEVVAAIPAAENMPGCHALRPGDVLRHRNGLTSEVVDPDCEGRLILADALAYLVEQKPAAVLDVATLTYACVAALGTQVTAAVGNDRGLMDAVCAAGAAVGEPIWELPLWQSYRRQLASAVADQRNEGRDDVAGAIVPALFLERFVAGTPWVHLDTGGTAYLPDAGDDQAAGGTGVLVRTLCHLLLNRPETPEEV